MKNKQEVSELNLASAYKNGCDAAIQEIITTVKATTPTHYSMQEKERWLNGYNDTKKEYKQGFNTTPT